MSIIAFVLAAGFVAAGLLSALHGIVQEQLSRQEDESVLNNGLVLYFDTPGSIAWSMIICIFAGPWLVLSQGIWFWRRDVLPFSGVVLCGCLSTIWSFCSGVFIFEVANAVGFLS